MADRRMITTKITDNDNFTSLPSSAQALYFHLVANADDDGFNDGVQVAMFKAHASIDDLKVLLVKRYLYQFENGVIVIKHWRMANILRKDRYTPTVFQDQLEMLGIDVDKSYVFKDSNKEIETSRFKKPTIEEIKKYCEERKNNVNPEKFFNYYESKGWKVGKSSMKDWKACVRTWENNNFDKNKQDVIPDYSNANNPTINEEKLKQILSERNK